MRINLMTPGSLMMPTETVSMVTVVMIKALEQRKATAPIAATMATIETIV